MPRKSGRVGASKIPIWNQSHTNATTSSFYDAHDVRISPIGSDSRWGRACPATILSSWLLVRLYLFIIAFYCNPSKPLIIDS